MSPTVAMLMARHTAGTRRDAPGARFPLRARRRAHSLAGRMSRLLIGLLLLVVATAAHAVDARRFRVQDGRLVDGRGREITLRGVNARANGVLDVTFDDGRLPLQDVPVFDAGDAERMQALGFNLLRLPINW